MHTTPNDVCLRGVSQIAAQASRICGSSGAWPADTAKRRADNIKKICTYFHTILDNYTACG